jgi:hypothetical protein
MQNIPTSHGARWFVIMKVVNRTIWIFYENQYVIMKVVMRTTCTKNQGSTMINKNKDSMTSIWQL